MELDRDKIARTLANARWALLESRVAAGHWEGELSSSALSTATAVFALWVYLREAPSIVVPAAGTPGEGEGGGFSIARSLSKPPPLPSPGVPGAGEKSATTFLTPNNQEKPPGSSRPVISVDGGESVRRADPAAIAGLIRNGTAWLARHQNADGGWGDTTDSISNISTTALCWAALSCAGETASEKQAVERAEVRLAGFAGSALRTDSVTRGSTFDTELRESSCLAAPLAGRGPTFGTTSDPRRESEAGIASQKNRDRFFSFPRSQHEPSAHPRAMKRSDHTHISARHPERSEGSLGVAAGRDPSQAQDDGLRPSAPFQSSTGGENDPANLVLAQQEAPRQIEPIRGSLDLAALAEAIARRYGKDRTFSVPILTFCAIAGRLGPAERAWKLVPQLPFELAALPQSWFRFARLPVVSYALPALIAIGHVRHYHRPTRNPFAWLARRLAAARTLRVLGTVQPHGGGFLEATPLTSFVVMSLAAGGHVGHPVVTNGIEFLVRSARPDGSWPIDTNLATWVTTLSINALAAGGPVAEHLRARERKSIRDWLIGQQYRVRHPYTGAPPGGWAWTDLPGGVPDADDTAGALLALHHLGEADEPTLDAVRAAVRWLLDLQNRDGGIPTFCRGWGKLPFDRSART